MTTRMPLNWIYIQLLLGFGFGGVKDCPIHEQSGCDSIQTGFRSKEEGWMEGG